MSSSLSISLESESILVSVEYSEMISTHLHFENEFKENNVIAYTKNGKYACYAISCFMLINVI